MVVTVVGQNGAPSLPPKMSRSCSLKLYVRLPGKRQLRLLMSWL